VNRSWRLRHKLVFGLALVVLSVGLLLGGSLLGLAASSSTMEAIARKNDEMQTLVILKDEIWKVIQIPGQDGNRPGDGKNTESQIQRELEHIDGQLKEVGRQIDACMKTQEFLAGDRLDPDGGEYERGQLAEIARCYRITEQEFQQATGTGVADKLRLSLLQNEEFRKAHARLLKLTDDLYAQLRDDVRLSSAGAKANHLRSRYITGVATGLAVIIILTLLYYFRVWVFRPIKELQAGVHRVHTGNFDQPIRLTSRDELEELANEFNAMTTRLRDIYKNLAQQVNERTRQLVRSERMVSVGFLAAGVAHEINNPLASIAFCSEALERRLQDLLVKSPGEAETITKYLKMIQQEAFRCKLITQKLLDFSRSGGKREPLELNRLVADVLEVAHHLPNARGKQLEFQPGDDVTALVSGPDVKSVVLNMVVNALDSMDEGGTLTTKLTAHPDSVEMTFTDTGCGMTPEVLENIFEPFFTRNRTGNGTGLGLSISHQIVDQHGGTIQVTSDGPGRGSTFRVRLPLQPNARLESTDRRHERTGPERTAPVRAAA
jgi:two-component system, NtrC family, sensor kinase